MIDGVSLGAGIGDNIATARPRSVIVTGSQFSVIRSMIRRHFAWNSAAAMFFTVICPFGP